MEIKSEHTAVGIHKVINLLLTFELNVMRIAVLVHFEYGWSRELLCAAGLQCAARLSERGQHFRIRVLYCSTQLRSVVPAHC